jgi:hypothetical protein
MSENRTFLVLSKTCNVSKKILGGRVLQPTPTPATDFPVSGFLFFSQTFSLAILLDNLPSNSLFQDPVFQFSLLLRLFHSTIVLGNPAFKQLVLGD